MRMILKKGLAAAVSAVMLCGAAGVLPQTFSLFGNMLTACAYSYNGAIRNNGLGDIYIDISQPPFTELTNQYSYGPEGCAWFASARARQLTGKVDIIWRSENWWNYGADSFGFTNSSTPHAPAFMCYNGHVAILEKIEGDTAYISEGGVTTYPENSYCQIKAVSTSSLPTSGGSFYGYVCFEPVSTLPRGVVMPDELAAGKTIPNGDYWIQSKVSSTAFVDPAPGSDVPAASCSNVTITDYAGAMPAIHDAFTFTYLNNGFYKITQAGTDLCLDVASAGMECGTNIQLYPWHDSYAQMWSVKKTEWGYVLQSKQNSFVLDVTGSNSATNTNVEVWEWNGTSGQLYNLIPYSDHTFKGSGTAASPYRISSAEDLRELAKCINNELSRPYFAEKYYTQTADIDLENEAFIPIGTKTEGNPGGGGFSGVYDGASHSVTGLNVKRSDQSYNGLFGWSYGGTIKNLSVSGSINGRSPAGGIIGEIGSGLSGTIENCSFTGSVNGSAAAGGIAGHIWCSGVIKNCYFNGSLSTDTESGVTGGIVANVSAGYNDSAGTVTLTNCYAASKSAVTGGIIGNFKTVVASTMNIKDNFYLKSMASAGSSGDLKNGGSALTDELLKTEAAEMLGAPFVQNDDANLNDGYPVFTWQTAPYQFQGEGTDASPYLITSKKELEIFRDLMNTEYRASAYSKASYKLTTDIDLSGSAWTPIAKRYLNGKDTGIYFCGHFDGGNHTVTGMSVNEKSKFAGFFGSISSGAVVENLIVKGSVVNTTLSTGGIVGEMCTGEATVRNCAFIGNVTGGDEAVGGVVGYLWQNGTVQNCYHIGTVTCPNHSTGGVVGKAVSETANTIGLIENCYHAGKLSGTTGSVVGMLSEKADIKAYVIVRNCFGLKADGALCGAGECAEFDAMQCNESTLQKAAPLLGDAFAANPDSTYINGYPVLAWELGQESAATKLGDVNEDGTVDVGDAVVLARYLAEDTEVIVTEQGRTNADCNKSGKPDLDDVTMILKAIARLITL